MSTLTEPITNTSHYTGFDLQFIAGEWRRGRSERANKDIDPYTGRTLVEIPQASAEDLDDAYCTAAKVQPEWARRPPGERGRVLTRVAQLMEARREEIITWLIREAGSTRLKANLE